MSLINDDMSADEFFDAYMDAMDDVGYEIFGIKYLDKYISYFPVEDEQNVRDSLIKLGGVIA